MNIYFIRHAEAEPSNESKPDGERGLTQEGISILKSSMLIWKNYQQHFDLVISSPLKRAIQTSEIIKEFFLITQNVITDRSLLNGGRTEEIILLAESLGVENVAIVGHQPDIADHIANFLGILDFKAKLKPASIIKISFGGNPKIGNGKLEFLIPPVNKKG